MSEAGLMNTILATRKLNVSSYFLLFSSTLIALLCLYLSYQTMVEIGEVKVVRTRYDNK